LRQEGISTGDWLHNLPVGWMALAIFGGTYLTAAGTFWLVAALARRGLARAFKGVSCCWRAASRVRRKGAYAA
jgi:hypothetical protein